MFIILFFALLFIGCGLLILIDSEVGSIPIRLMIGVPVLGYGAMLYSIVFIITRGI